LENQTISPFYNQEQKILGYISVKADVTYEKELERKTRQTQRLESIGALASGIAHDFNNILTPMLSFTELLQRKNEKNTSQMDYLQRLEKGILRAKALIAKIQQFSKNRKSDESYHAVNLEKMVPEVLDLIRNSLHSTIEVKSDLSANLPRIFGDESEIHSILINLCINASHAMPEGGQLQIGLSVPPAQVISKIQIPYGRYLCLSVRDTGCGMDRQTQEKIFEPFFTTKEVGKGTGMGLATVYGILKRMGGYIEVESSPGQGSKFSIYFPVYQSQTEMIPEEDLSPTLGPNRILLVDDEEEIRAMGKTYLESLGYQVAVSASGKEALKLIRVNASCFDLVIVDQFMPEMSGWQLRKEIQEISPNLPVAMASEAYDVLKAGDLGRPNIALFIQKPFNRQKLGSAVNHLLRRQPDAFGDALKLARQMSGAN
ncbi:MAG: ATP-binding protein, partial [Deltaproteobacteria bacterium]|nr:ATP-binding protein [Deltaproteobacteria bacterium]